MAPNLSLRESKSDPKWDQHGALGRQNEAKLTPKWSLGTPKNACGNLSHKKSSNERQKVILAKIRDPFLEPLLNKNRCRKWRRKPMSPKSSFGQFLADVGDTVWVMLATFGPSTQKKCVRVEMSKWAPRLSEKLTFEDAWGSKSDKKRPETENWTHVFRGKIWDQSLGAF